MLYGVSAKGVELFGSSGISAVKPEHHAEIVVIIHKFL